jgi:DNA-binding transcriptional MocR family regulator
LLITSALQNHILDVLQPAYCSRYHCTLSAIREYLFPLGFTIGFDSPQVAGGYFIWLGLPKPLRSDDLVSRAMDEENLKIASGHLFQVQGDTTEGRSDFQDYVRVCFAWENRDKLAEGIRRLADLARRTISAETARYQI